MREFEMTFSRGVRIYRVVLGFHLASCPQWPLVNIKGQRVVYAE